MGWLTEGKDGPAYLKSQIVPRLEDEPKERESQLLLCLHYHHTPYKCTHMYLLFHYIFLKNKVVLRSTSVNFCILKGCVCSLYQKTIFLGFPILSRQTSNTWSQLVLTLLFCHFQWQAFVSKIYQCTQTGALDVLIVAVWVPLHATCLNTSRSSFVTNLSLT